jgi:hypothetical protein
MSMFCTLLSERIRKLRELETIGGGIDSYAQSIRDQAAAQEIFDVTEVDRGLRELSKRTRSLSDATVARLNASR